MMALHRSASGGSNLGYPLPGSGTGLTPQAPNTRVGKSRPDSDVPKQQG